MLPFYSGPTTNSLMDGILLFHKRLIHTLQTATLDLTENVAHLYFNNAVPFRCLETQFLSRTACVSCTFIKLFIFRFTCVVLCAAKIAKELF